jgi:hypothetical protein
MLSMNSEAGMFFNASVFTFLKCARQFFRFTQGLAGGIVLFLHHRDVVRLRPPFEESFGHRESFAIGGKFIGAR